MSKSYDDDTNYTMLGATKPINDGVRSHMDYWYT
jgi:hypothetical protein